MLSTYDYYLEVTELFNLTENIYILTIAFIIDLIVGDPYWMPHPVRAIGNFINFEENLIRKYFDQTKLKIAGLALLVDTVLFTALSVALIIIFLGKIHPYLGFAIKVYFAYTAISARSLHYEGIMVKKALLGSLEEGRKRVGYIVGRDTNNLSSDEIVKATVETVAENTTDGIISPMIYLLIGGPILAMAYKAVSTLDSMVGYMNEKYIDLGRYSAKTDDILNYVPARLSGYLMSLSALILLYDFSSSLKILKRDHGNHKSPNSAWTESAVAGALNIQLGGTHDYFGISVYKPTIGDNIRNVEPEDIDKTIKLMYVTSTLFLLLANLIRILFG